jgi:P4 family phage/plasmid primase-like protien
MNNVTPAPEANLQQQAQVIPTTSYETGTKPVQIGNFPAEFRQSDSFLRWQYFYKDDGKTFKSPVNAQGSKRAYSDSAIHLPFTALAEAVRTSSCKIGISLGTGGLTMDCDGRTGYLCCLDFDGFVELGGDRWDDGVNGMVMEIDSYNELSPSTTGFKVFFLTDKPPEKKFDIRFSPSEFAQQYPDISKYKDRRVEVFSKGYFMTLTGDLFDESHRKLRFVAATELDELLSFLHDAAVESGGQGIVDRKCTTGKPTGDNPSGTYSRLKPRSLELVLKHIDHFDEGTWSDVANALARVYGEDGGEYFAAYSRGDYAETPYPKFDIDEVNERYDRALSELTERPDGYGVNELVRTASTHREWSDPVLKYEDPLLDNIGGIGKYTKIDRDSPIFLINQADSTENSPASSQDQTCDIDADDESSVADIANGKIFAMQNRGKLIYIDETDQWLQFKEPTGWLSAPPKAAEAAAKAVADDRVLAAADAFKADPKSSTVKQMLAEATRSSKAPQIRAMIDMAKSEPGMMASLREFDSDHWLLGVSNGVLDLRRGKLLPVTPDLYVSKRCNVAYDPEADCPLFKRYLSQVVPDNSCREFLVRWCGYLLTGDVSEQKFVFLYGSGRNGKSVLIELISRLLGDYSRKIQTEMLMKQFRSSQGPSPDIVGLHGKRLVYCNETTEGRHLDDARVKELTGGDTLSGRVPYAKTDVEFPPNHKLVVVGNHQPVISDNSLGMWRRMIVLHFSETIPEDDVDKHLLEKLTAESPGILNMFLGGLRDWKTNGLMIPDVLQKATDAYRRDQDILADWIDEHCEIGVDHTQKKADLYAAYKSWCRTNGYKNPLTQKRYSRQLTERGYRTSADNRTVAGLCLNTAGKSASDSWY